jgi:predicted protein tyrosine phosphatase
MSRILVSSLSGLGEALERHRPSHLVSLLSPPYMIATPDGFDPRQHLKLGIDDVREPAGAENPPERLHVDRLLSFARGWDANAPILVHCWAGISRSMASAYVILCDRLGDGRECEIALAMRRRAPHASPNSLLVRHADEVLGRDGRMVAALEAMGPPVMMLEGAITDFPLVDL